MTLRRFEFSVCSANPKDLPPSLAQHASCWGLLHPHHFTFRTHVGGVVVEDQVNPQFLGDLAVDGGQELHELLMTVPGQAPSDDRPVSTSRAANNVVVPCRL